MVCWYQTPTRRDTDTKIKNIALYLNVDYQKLEKLQVL